MIKFVIDVYGRGTYEGYTTSCEDFNSRVHRIYLTPNFVGITSSYTSRTLGVYGDDVCPDTDHFTKCQVERHLNMAVLRVVCIFLDGEMGSD